ncbi:RNA polymerase sigma factor [Methylomonas fluvii]|uniref:RNA polymerase sigma factor n=1 Tax=Methylomonas fluvii TaxID=1854564 RepID=A0ABR9DCK0_9GAMM|nr:RNA polymerase sigma factor [Methylomonas fluvii]MBD9360561.1 RNA polymerase sigma factor [Methylomonas fluvii]CAD6873393.1 RNA polymerase sigma factor RpoE [Methylomonas fluvii]
MASNHPPLTAAFLRHQTELRQFLVRRVNCADTANDLLHDTFLHIADYSAQRQIANSRAFLYRVAGNLALDYLRGQARRQARNGGELDDEWPCPSPPPERCMQGWQQWQAVEIWLRGLPPANRQTLCPYRLDGKTHRQIAAELRVTERHVEYLLSRTGQLLVETGLRDG